MPEPEIARRCPSCGASIRAIAFFCPQCGRGLSAAGADPQSDSAHRAATEPLHQNTAPLETPGGKGVTDTPKGKAGQAALSAVGANIRRATNMARDVEGDMVQRVKKVRQISSVVLDEAAYDPSLRFVLVAAFLFILFLVIVLLNRFIT